MTTPTNSARATLWVDSEVHLLPPEGCSPNYQPPAEETGLHRVIYDHPERDAALARATLDGLLSEMEAARIDRAVITALPWHSPAACWRNTAYISELVRHHPQRLTGLGVLPPPGHENLRDAVRRIREEYGLSGVKVIPSWQDYRLDDEVFEPALAQMETDGLVLMPHTDHLYRPPAQSDTAAALYEICRRHPGLRVLAPHLGGLLCLYGLYPAVRSVLENVLFVGSVPRTMPMVTMAVQAIGADRVAFGTDFPFNPSHDQRQVLAAFEALPLSADEQRLIAGANVLRFLGVPA